MTTTTPILGLPYPENTDPVTLGADAIRDLALAIDTGVRVTGGIVYGTPQSGYLDIPTGLDVCWYVGVVSGDTEAAGEFINGSAAPRGAAYPGDMTVRLVDIYSRAPLNGIGVAARWIAVGTGRSAARADQTPALEEPSP